MVNGEEATGADLRPPAPRPFKAAAPFRLQIPERPRPSAALKGPRSVLPRGRRVARVRLPDAKWCATGGCGRGVGRPWTFDDDESRA